MTESASELVSSCVQRAQEAAASGTLLRLPFETLFEYLKVTRLVFARLRSCTSDHTQGDVKIPCGHFPCTLQEAYTH